ncbi:hypothetical protein [Microcoleus sp. FACHB-68]|uniref:hypothetical protein n=1 Tax=Microcoleus sp. FACHB-68 TaxID=2692826 RepID=UPI001685CA8C|nr:hypothetical protein [Microcoleus sp. FACHB-68]MBD1940661.1 hypothetical protein [Microcoleus sp. FACHB-68]
MILLSSHAFGNNITYALILARASAKFQGLAGIGEWGLGIGHWAWGMGHGARLRQQER